jgi:hypothetical protein
MELAYALVGEQLDLNDDICGAGKNNARSNLLDFFLCDIHPNRKHFSQVLSRRTKADRLAVWVRDKDNVEAINGIGYAFCFEPLEHLKGSTANNLTSQCFRLTMYIASA